MFSQDWKLGGNSDAGPPLMSGLLTNSNYFGGLGTANVILGTSGTSRIFMGGSSFINPGYVGIGSNFTTPSSLLHVHQSGAGVSSMRFSTSITGSSIFDGFEIGVSPAGDAFFINNENNQNFSWYNQGGGAPGTLLGRMRLYDGGIGQTTGRLALSNNLPLNFNPNDRIHMHEDAVTGTNAIRQSSSFTGVTATDGYVQGINNANGLVFQTQFETQPILWYQPIVNYGGSITEVMRIQNNNTYPTTSGAASTDGYIGLFQDSAIFHIDGITPSYPAGELFVGFNPSDVPKSKMGMLNATTQDGKLLPTFFGNTDGSQSNVALQTIGAIATSQDISSNPIPVTRFLVGRDWTFNLNPIDNLSEIQNRPAFAWHNGSRMKMLMNANGRVLIQEGINQANPVVNNRLEVVASAGVNGGPNDPYWNVVNVNGASGVRLTNLPNTKTPFNNTTNGVLSVDSVGNIILVNDKSGGASANVGNFCGAQIANPLTNHFGIPLANFNYYFEGQGYKNNAVFIGIPCATTPAPAKLNILENNGTLSTLLNDVLIGTQSEIVDLSGALWQEFIGVKGISIINDPNLGSFRPVHIGGDFMGAGAALNHGVRGRAIGNTGVNYGGSFKAGGTSGTNFGVYGDVLAAGSPNNIAVYGTALSANGTNTTTNNHYAGYFNGGVYVAQTITASDELIKRDRYLISTAIEKINLIEPISFRFDTAVGNQNGLSLPLGLQYGFKAQQLELIYPELVSMVRQPPLLDDKGNQIKPAYDFKGINYTGFIALLTKAVQELKAEKDSLRKAVGIKDSIFESRLSALENTVNACCSSSISNSSNQEESLEKLPTYNVNIGNDDLPMLAQNIPNPYGNTTNIQFNIPKSTMSAQIVFFNEQGMILNSVEINTKGRGQINLNAEKLENGLYFYSLIIDGKKVDTKKMVKSE